ncbi:hypothetical protein niasHT_014690 [Heterodera trifolii]|uniref:Uncharacterized protein n=1 Tax=Heterodera trifolii TaxID=157864 RepID=A0ABD2LI21_9BILA
MLPLAFVPTYAIVAFAKTIFAVISIGLLHGLFLLPVLLCALPEEKRNQRKSKEMEERRRERGGGGGKQEEEERLGAASWPRRVGRGELDGGEIAPRRVGPAASFSRRDGRGELAAAK